jgi:probable HAF family extracellular repeat protein
MNRALFGASARARLIIEFALGCWSKSKRCVVRRRLWKCEALSIAMIAAVVLLARGGSSQAQSCVGTLGPCFQALGFLAPLATPPASIPTAISPDGSVVVGYSTDGSGTDEGFRWAAGTMTGLGFPGCTGDCQSHATGVNQQAIISGYVGNIGPSVSHPYSWTNGVATPLPLLSGGTTSLAGGVAAQTNVIAGSGDPGAQAIVWQNGVATALPPLSTSIPSSTAAGVSGNGQVIVGSSSYDPSNPSNTQAVMWQGAVVTPLPFLDKYTYSSAVAANADGSVILGQSATVIPRSAIPVRWVNGIPSVPGVFVPYAIDATGLVAAGAAPPNAVPGATRWTPAGLEESIQPLLTAAGVDTTGWIFQRAVVNGNGRMFAGYGTDPNGHYQAFIARLPLPASLVTMHTHDFSGEGKSDLLWQGPTSVGPSPAFPVAVWTMNGAQIVQSAGIGTFPSNLAIIGQRDFNGDGYADILWRDSSGNLSMWFMNGTQVSSTVAVGSVPNNWAVHGTGDLNGDGKGDLLWRDSATGAVSVWFMDGGNVLATAYFGVVPSSWTIIADDNRGDILWQDNSGNLAIWQINGTQVVNSAGLGNVPPGSGWSISGIGDFNGDGFIDILWRNLTGVVSIWFSNVNAAQNNSPYIASTTSLGSVPSNFNIAQTGDYNGDGTSDILWRDNQGNLSIWFMAACGTVACVSSSAGIGNVGGWTLQALNVE